MIYRSSQNGVGMYPPRSLFRIAASCVILVLGGVLFVSFLWSGGGMNLVDGLSAYRAASYLMTRNIQQADYNVESNGKSLDFLVNGGSRIRADLSEAKGAYPIGHGEFGTVDDPVRSILMDGLITPDVHYLWCGQRWFEFKQYLGVMSVLRSMRPDKIYFHYEYKPEADKIFYNQWLDNLKYDYPWFHVIQMDRDLVRYCTISDYNERVNIVLRLLNRDGGMFVGENTWMLNFPPAKRLVDFDFALQRHVVEGYVLLRRGVLPEVGSYKQLLTGGEKSRYKRSVCARVDHIYRKYEIYNVSSCLIVTGYIYEKFNPMDIWELNDPFGRLTRKLFYGTEEIRRPVPTYDELVPNIAHMIWIGGGRMDYVFYLSVLSVLYVAKMEIVYIHGDLEPAGNYWREIKTMPQTKDRVQFIIRSPPTQIYQGNLDPWFRALMSDLIRVDLMVKYGGVYTDTDAIWVKPLSEEDRGYEAVASFDWVDWSWPFPDSVNFGVSYGKKNAPFWRIFLESMRTLHNDIHGFTGVMMPYKLLEKYPHLLRIDRRLQVICYEYRCHPIYVPDYHNTSKDHTNMNSIPNWREDVNAFHWTHPNPKEYANRSTLLSSTGLFADIGRNVLKMAGLL